MKPLYQLNKLYFYLKFEKIAALMKKAKKHFSFLFFAITLIIIFADSPFFEKRQSYNSSQNTSTSMNLKHCPAECFEDNVFSNDCTMTTIPFLQQTLIIQKLAVLFKTNYKVFIWQPPKLT